ncbi:hypothetical protein N325_07191, partial [Colius striatus]
RETVTIWRDVVSTSRTADMVLRELICVLEDWPLHSTSTSDGHSTDLFALAATRALHGILQMPLCSTSLRLHFPRLLLALLFQIFFSTEEMPEKVSIFWRQCQ